MLLIEICENIDPEILQELQLSKKVKGAIAGILLGTAAVGGYQMGQADQSDQGSPGYSQTHKSTFNMSPTGDGNFQVQDSEIGNFSITRAEWSKIWSQSKQAVKGLHQQLKQQNPDMRSRGIEVRVDAAEREARIAMVRELGQQKVSGGNQTQRSNPQQQKTQQSNFQGSGIASQGQEGDVESF